ncbi:hypothetical protein BH23PLA1_BH23PLA1_11140 [soil metagenome]
MWLSSVKGTNSLIDQVQHSIEQTTHGQIRDLSVEEVQGRVVVCGQAPSYHAKQLAFQAALELLPSDRFSANITVV